MQGRERDLERVQARVQLWGLARAWVTALAQEQAPERQPRWH